VTRTKAKYDNITARRFLRAFLPFLPARRYFWALLIIVAFSSASLTPALAAPKKKPKKKAKAPEVKRKADNPILFSADEQNDRSIGYADRAPEQDSPGEESEQQAEQVAPNASTDTASSGTFVGLDFNRKFDAVSAVNAYVAETENGLADMVEARLKIEKLLVGAKRQNLVVTVNLLQSNIEAIDEIQLVAQRYTKELKKMVEDSRSRREIYFKLRSFRNIHTRALMLRSEAVNFYERSTGSEFIDVEYLGEARDYAEHEKVDVSDIDDESLVLGNDTIELPESEKDDE
jgi:hypothetical protein